MYLASLLLSEETGKIKIKFKRLLEDKELRKKVRLSCFMEGIVMKHYSDVEKSDAEKVSKAAQAISQNNFPEARRLLNEVISNTPANYTYSFKADGKYFIKFWNQDEYIHYVMGLSDENKENVIFILSAYPRAYYYLAYIDVHEGNFKSAISHLENCLKLEPDQPDCYCEMALAYGRLGQTDRAVSLYDKALKARPHMTTHTRACALRGIGIELIELQQLDFAEKYLKESLKYDPDSTLARNELQYINGLRVEGKARETEPMEITSNMRPTPCDYCGNELAAGGSDGFTVFNIEGRVLYLCTSCKKKPNIEAEVLLKVFKTQFDILYKHGQYDDALEYAKRIMQIVEQSFGPDDPAMALALNDLSLTYKKLGRYVEAEPLCHQSLMIYEKSLGADHPHVAVSLTNMADLYRLLNKNENVEPFLMRALEIKINAFGPDHPSVGVSLNGLAMFCQAQGRHEQAEALLVQAIYIFLNADRPVHPGCAIAVNNLANVFISQERYEEAEYILKETLEIREKDLGPDHPDIASSLNNLAVVYIRQNRFKEAEGIYERTLNLLLKSVGPNSAEFAGILANLAELCAIQEDYEDAELLYKKVLVIYENNLGPDHPSVIAVLTRLLDLYQKQERYEEIESLRRRLNAIDKKS